MSSTDMTAHSQPPDTTHTEEENPEPDVREGHHGTLDHGSAPPAPDATRPPTQDRRAALQGLVVRWWVRDPCTVSLPRIANCSLHGHRRLGVDQESGDIVCYLCHPELNPHDPAFTTALRPVAPVASVPRTPSIFDSIPRDMCPICMSLNYTLDPDTETWYCDHGEGRKRLAAARRKRKATKRRQPDPVPREPVESQASGNGMAQSDASPASKQSRGRANGRRG